MFVSQATMMSRMNESREPRGHSRELRAYVQREYGGDGSYVRTLIAQAGRARSARRDLGIARGVVQLLARIPASLAAAFATPGGA